MVAAVVEHSPDLPLKQLQIYQWRVSDRRLRFGVLTETATAAAAAAAATTAVKVARTQGRLGSAGHVSAVT